MSTKMNPDAFNMDIPILTRSPLQSRGPYPPTPLYWSEAMERESASEKRRAALEDEWVITTERGKFVGRVDMDEMTA
ncbi:hypothetical protein QFC20_003946 [Naganishia adeliensis]|uniref:Uncharacterized protein n=1 Tax=Naganishia adeliensis TaxID=92952 RepID=A0ACC2W8L2_9TREE|nr:hypothetical protein QFC20_003946 [Naganishia adeliensis]